MAITTSQAQGLVLALFGASAGGHLTSLAAASDMNSLAADLSTSAGLILGKDLSSNTAFRNHVTGNLKLTGDTLTAANAWLDGQLNAGAARGDIVATAVTFLATLTDTTSPFYAAAQTFNTTVAAAVTWSTGDGATTFGVSALRANQGNVDVVAGSSFVLTTGTDTVIGTAGNDTITGASTTYADADRILDVTTGDADTFNLSAAAAVNPDVTNVESVNITLSALSALAVDASKLTGVSTLTVTRDNVTVGGATLTGDKAVSVTNVDASGVAKIVAGAGSKSLNVDAAATDKAGLVVDADVVTGNVTVDGAATISAAASITTVSIDAVTNTTAAETAKASSITANLAATVTTHADLTGAITINAAKASTITVNDAQGGATVNGATTSTADSTITVVDVDASGATIVTGTGSATAALKQITIAVDGTALTTDAVSISAAGVIALDLDGGGAGTVDLVTLSGNDAAVTYNLGTNAGTAVSYTKAGTNSVTVAGNVSHFTGVTVTGVDVLDLDAGTAGAIAGSKWTSIGKVDLGFDNAGNAITVSEGLKVEITAAQANTNFDYGTAAKNMTIIAGDVNGTANTAVGTLTTGTLDAAAGATDVGTVTIIANDANMTVTTGTVVGAKQTIVVEGDEDVNLAAVTALAVNASASTGIITLTATTNLSGTVTTGSGADVLTANGADVHTFAAGAGNDTITITDTQATSSFDGGDGDDTINLDKAAIAYVVVAGAGDDTLNTAIDLDAVVVGGDGSDTLVIGAATLDLADNTNFAMSGIEKLNLTSATGTTVISAAQLANNPTLSIVADGDQLDIEIDPTAAAVGGTLNASAVTIATGSTAILNYVGSSKSDVITGGVAAELFTMTAGDDTIDGGTGTGKIDKFTAAAVADTGTAVSAVINLSGTAVTATDILAKTGYRTAADAEAGAGTAQTLFNDTTATNNAAITSLTNIESVVGTSGKDYIVAAASGTIIEGGAGADYIKLGAGADTVRLTVTATSDDIAGFQVGAGGDVIAIDESAYATINFANTGAVAALAAGDYNEIAAAGTIAADKVNVITTAAGYANYAAAIAAVTAAGDSNEAFVLFYNSTSGKAELYFDADADATTGSEVLIAQIDITGANLVNLSEVNFAVF